MLLSVDLRFDMALLDCAILRLSFPALFWGPKDRKQGLLCFLSLSDSLPFPISSPPSAQPASSSTLVFLSWKQELSPALPSTALQTCDVALEGSHVQVMP